MNREEIKEGLLKNDIIKALTLDERNVVITEEQRPVTDGARERYLEISSRAKADKIEEKCSVENLKKEDFYMAFYDLNNIEINEKLFKYIEERDWFNFFVDALAEFEKMEESEEDVFESKYTIHYACLFLILHGKKKLEKCILNLKNIVVSRQVINKMIEQMAGNLLQVYSKTVIYEYHMNKDKYADTKNQNKLNLYIKDNFVCVDKIIPFFLKYPVLIRRLAKKVMNMVDYYEEMLINIDNEYCQIRKKEMISDNIMTDISCDIGDTHEKGKFVVQVRFGERKVIYKPRNLFISGVYNEFISWINTKFDLYKLPTIKMILKDDYTIEECVEYEGCKSEREIERYYTRIGYYIGILYLLNGNDIHYENIIAGGEYPYIIDLETLFAHNSEQMLYERTAAEKIARYINQSVKGSCLLPSYMFGDKKQKGIDVSGLGGRRAELPGERLVLSDMNSDNIRFEMKKTYIEDNKNIPMLKEQRVSYEKYKHCIISGFMDFMNIIEKNKQEFIEKIESFADVKTRQVLRATNNYGQILQYASHPAYTHDIIYLERMLESVWNYPYKDKRICSCEMQELINDDIPIFYNYPSSTEIVSGGGAVIDEIYEKSALDIVKDRISELDDDSIYMQSLIIKESLGLLTLEEEEAVRKQADMTRYAESGNSELTEELVDNVLKNIYSILEKNGVYGEDDINWLSIVNDNYGNKAISYMQTGIMNGTSGVLLYLLYEYEASGEEKYMDMMKKIVKGLNHLQGIESKKSSLSGLEGIFSMIYPLQRYIELTMDNEAIAMYDSIFAWCMSYIDNINYEEESVEGMSALLQVFTGLYKKTGDHKYYKAVKTLINRLLQWGEYYIMATLQDKTGYGLCYALMVANELVEDEKLSKMCANILEYCKAHNSERTYKESLYKIKLYNICKEEWLMKEAKQDMRELAALELIQPEQILHKVDFLIEYMRTFGENENCMEGTCRAELLKLIKMYRMYSDDNNYNYIVHGLGLNSPVCGLALRLQRYRRSA